MTVKEIYEAEYKDYSEFFEEGQTKYHWASKEIFDLTTYDDDLDELFVKKIIEVCKAIIDRKTFEYINVSADNYVTYIIVCNLLEEYDWIEWGTSVGGAWFQEGPNFRHYLLNCTKNESVPFTIENLKALCEFIEED